MTAVDLVRIVRALEERGVEAWLDGGWAVDAVLGVQRRAHDDLDLVVDIDDVDRAREALAELGFAVASGAARTSIELVDEEGRQVDIHPVRFTETGDGLYRMESGGDWIYPCAGFGGEGVVLGSFVRCLTPEVQLRCHTGYPPHRTSYDDVSALSARFGLAVPDEYRGARESYPERITSA